MKIAEQYLKKGSKIYLEGRSETRKWQDAEKKDRYTTEIVLRPFSGEILMLDNKKDDGDAGGAEPARDAAPPPAELEDEIPY